MLLVKNVNLYFHKSDWKYKEELTMQARKQNRVYSQNWTNALPARLIITSEIPYSSEILEIWKELEMVVLYGNLVEDLKHLNVGYWALWKGSI